MLSPLQIKSHPCSSRFVLEGIVRELIGEPGRRPKVLVLVTAAGDYEIKLTKLAWYGLYPWPKPGDWLQVVGERKFNPEKGKLKLKADGLYAIAPQECPLVSLTQSQPYPSQPCQSQLSKSKILVCQGSDCRRRGAREVQQAVENSLRDRGLAEQVSVRTTGCMHACKKGPVVVFMPEKNRYQQVTAKQVPILISENVTCQTQIEPGQPA